MILCLGKKTKQKNKSPKNSTTEILVNYTNMQHIIIDFIVWYN